MIKVRNGTEFSSGMVSVGFWLGLTLGRVILGFITPRIGEKLAVSVTSPSSPSQTQPTLTPTPTDIPPYRHGPRTPLLASPLLLRLRNSSFLPRVLPWPPLPRHRRRHH